MKASFVMKVGSAALVGAFLTMGAGTSAFAATITLDVAGVVAAATNTTCAPACTLGGSFVLDNTNSTINSINITMTGGSPVAGPFTIFSGNNGGFWDFSNSAGDSLRLLINSNLAGYLGGPILNIRVDSFSGTIINPVSWFPGTGTLTVQATPIPAALPLFASGLGVIGLLGWRRKKKRATLAV